MINMIFIELQRSGQKILLYITGSIEKKIVDLVNVSLMMKLHQDSHRAVEILPEDFNNVCDGFVMAKYYTTNSTFSPEEMLYGFE